MLQETYSNNANLHLVKMFFFYLHGLLRVLMQRMRKGFCLVLELAESDIVERFLSLLTFASVLGLGSLLIPH
jgi:hypothetical protein